MDIIDRLSIEARKEPHEPIWLDAIAEIARLRLMLEAFKNENAECFSVAQQLDTGNPELPGAFTGTPSERIKRQLAARITAHNRALGLRRLLVF